MKDLKTNLVTKAIKNKETKDYSIRRFTPLTSALMLGAMVMSNAWITPPGGQFGTHYSLRCCPEGSTCAPGSSVFAAYCPTRFQDCVFHYRVAFFVMTAFFSANPFPNLSSKHAMRAGLMVYTCGFLSTVYASLIAHAFLGTPQLMRYQIKSATVLLIMLFAWMYSEGFWF